MADALDLAQEEQAFMTDIALKSRKPAGPVARGYCLECGDEDVGGQRWCSAECARIWERREKQQLGRL